MDKAEPACTVGIFVLDPDQSHVDHFPYDLNRSAVPSDRLEHESRELRIVSAFRCYLTGADGHFRDFVSLEAASDIEALELAKALPAAHAGFELWNGSRLIYHEGALIGAAIEEHDSAGATFGSRLRNAAAKLEHIATSVGETLAGGRNVAADHVKEKRRPRR